MNSRPSLWSSDYQTSYGIKVESGFRVTLTVAASIVADSDKSVNRNSVVLETKRGPRVVAC